MASRSCTHSRVNVIIDQAENRSLHSEAKMTILLVVLLVVLLLSLPVWPHSANFGSWPVFVVLIVLVILLLAGVL